MKDGYCKKCGYPHHMCKCHEMHYGCGPQPMPEMKHHMDYLPDICCHIPDKKECVKTVCFKVYRTCRYKMVMVCPRCSCEFDYHQHRGMCPQCMGGHMEHMGHMS